MLSSMQGYWCMWPTPERLLRQWQAAQTQVTEVASDIEQHKLLKKRVSNFLLSLIAPETAVKVHTVGIQCHCNMC